ncbi:efflux RND transporter periplasmic adaptor subunit [Albimonas sp. CAU 1670]|uniref:efflux RND transporter periplasmic adaptor subunit n=1 Tax=Albimonas sp. CAU 1670 TaxID=3032599 RepID=UPI0023D990CF|nr:efflux RND transporter periplasmic adaptor subunit [Albimonas sp. CAU 1670]MDF2234106.1 efflux RND transporter periplasmic adaptor subunit [Albimonas sp. CAU 1670]
MRRTARLRLSPPILLLCLGAPALAQERVFEGRIEARSSAVVASGRDGKVVEILFSGGEAVKAGDPLIRLDDAFQALNLEIAAAEARAARARARLAAAEATRMQELGRRDVASAARIDAAQAEAEVAAAQAERAAAAEAAARLTLERSVLRAPLAGRIGRPLVAVGAFVEAAAGPPLAEIVALDPVVVAYAVPYDARLATLKEAGSRDLAAVLARISAVVSAADRALVSGPVRPDSTEATVDPATGAMTVRALLPNPDELFRPGMRVVVTSTLGPAPEAAE